MLGRALLVLLLAVSAAGCQKPKCRGELERDDLERLRELVEKGKDPCPEHLRPTISASRTGVEVGDRLLVRDLPAEGHVLKLDALFRELKQNRETWKQLHPGDSFTAHPVVRIAPEVSAALGASTLATVAFAGYPIIHLVTGAIELDFGYAVPGPPRPDEDERPRPRELWVEWVDAGRYDGRVREGNVVVSSIDHAALDALVNWMVVGCSIATDPCASIIVLRPRGDFFSVATLLDRVMMRSKGVPRPPTIRFASEVSN